MPFKPFVAMGLAAFVVPIQRCVKDNVLASRVEQTLFVGEDEMRNIKTSSRQTRSIGLNLALSFFFKLKALSIPPAHDDSAV